jgi:hypothetical protein
MAGFRDLVDYTLWRVAALALGLMLVAATLGVIAYRLALAHVVARSRRRLSRPR